MEKHTAHLLGKCKLDHYGPHLSNNKQPIQPIEIMVDVIVTIIRYSYWLG